MTHELSLMGVAQCICLLACRGRQAGISDGEAVSKAWPPMPVANSDRSAGWESAWVGDVRPLHDARPGHEGLPCLTLSHRELDGKVVPQHAIDTGQGHLHGYGFLAWRHNRRLGYHQRDCSQRDSPTVPLYYKQQLERNWSK